MKLQYLASAKGKKVAGHNIPSWTNRRRRIEGLGKDGLRYFATESSSPSQLRDEAAREHVKELSSNQKAKKEARALDRDFFISVLGSSATKRDARSYLQRFTPRNEATTKPIVLKSHPIAENTQIPFANGVNLGGFYGTARAVSESPKFVQQPEQKQKSGEIGPQLHIALVKLRAPQSLDDETLFGVGRTISQLGRLGLTSVVVVDCSDRSNTVPDNVSWRNLVNEQAERIVIALDAHGEAGARLVNNAIGISEKVDEVDPDYPKGKAYVTMREILLTPLRRGTIPVIPPLGYTDASQTSVLLPSDEIVLALTREFAGNQPSVSLEGDLLAARDPLRELRKEVSLDRLIILDPLGGIPASDRPNGYHVFLNMEQEFKCAQKDLLETMSLADSSTIIKELKLRQTSGVDSINPNSDFVEAGFGILQTAVESLQNPSDPGDFNTNGIHHLRNLQLVRSVLSILPPSSSALLTTPDEAANSAKVPDTPFQAAGVGTRRLRNPLIHNLLTDKPVFSSSLPVGRIGPSPAPTTRLVAPAFNITPTTFAKHGMSVTIFPDPKEFPWVPPEPGKPQLSLTDPQIDLPRLVHLIEDSFGRTLDVKDFLKRINGHVAGVIIAGEYEGGALLTWETPDGVVDDGSPESRARMVPYLDKFAVLKRSQGSGGTADVVFKAMVRECFPEGVCWRSRKTNVVNKWYFERSRGTWKLPETSWTMFWTTPDLSLDRQKFRDYESVCRGVVPSWADNKTVLD